MVKKLFSKEEYLKEIRKPIWGIINGKTIEIGTFGKQYYFETLEKAPKVLLELYELKESGSQILIPFLKGRKKWLFEYINKYQPKTAKVLENASDIFGVCEISELGNLNILTSVAFELFGKVIQINVEHDNRIFQRTKSLPKELMCSYYKNFSGLIHYSTYFIVKQLPLYQGSWTTLDEYMENYRIPKKKYDYWYNYLEKYFEPFENKGTYEPCLDFMCFLMTKNIYEDKKGATALFVDTRVENGNVYVIKNGDIENIKMLSNPVEVIDSYIAYVLETLKTDFDFTPYLIDIPVIREVEEYKSYKLELDVNYVKGEIVGDVSSVCELFEEVERIALFNDFEHEFYYLFKTETGEIVEEDYIHISNVFMEDILEEKEIETIECKAGVIDEDEKVSFVCYIKFNISKGIFTIVSDRGYTKSLTCEDLKEKIRKVIEVKEERRVEIREEKKANKNKKSLELIKLVEEGKL